MTKSSKPPAWLLAGLAFAVGLAVGLGGKVLGFAHGPVGAGLLSATMCVAATPLMIAYWRHLDEAAREAHKFAWYWGGSAGLLAVVIAFSVLTAPGAEMITADFMGAERPRQLLAKGILATILAQVVGYTVAWVGWWIARR